MGEPKAKLTSGNVCCFGVSHVGVPVATVMAHMCPSLGVAVIDLNPERIMQWNTKQIPNREPKVEEMLRKSQNRNLVFSANMVGVIKKAEIIIISIDAPVQTSGSGEGKFLSLGDIEEAARIIARESDNNKIIVVKSTVPVGTNQLLVRVLQANRQGSADFQVLSVPEFFSAGNAISSLLHPDKVLIGSDLSSKALEATETLASLYSSWVPRNRIMTMKSQSAELAKIAENALLAVRLSSMSALAILCEKSDGDVSDLVNMVGSDCLELSLGFGGTQLKKDLGYLVHLCESLKLSKAADYWNQVLLMNEYHENRFYKRILSAFFNTLNRKKIAIWGLTFKKNVEATNDSIAFELCMRLAEEGAKLNLCDPKMESRQVLNDLKAMGMTDQKSVAYFDDPYKAARKTDAIVVLTDWEELRTLDFNIIYKDMLRPAHIFDARRLLPHEELMKIGFQVTTIGKVYEAGDKFEYL